MALPDFIHRYLMTTVLKKTVVTYLLLDRDGTVAECGRGFPRFGLPVPSPGSHARALPFFDDDLPQPLEEPQVLPLVRISGDHHADIHLVPAGERIGVVLVDVSEEARHQILLQQAHDAVRLLEERLCRETETADQARSRFLGTMSHEILTPINGVIGTSLLLQETGLSAEQREYVDIIRTSADSLLQIIRDILDLSKIEAGRLELSFETFDLLPVVEAMGDVLLHPIHEKGLAFAALVDPNVPPRLVGDADRLRQILLNLAGNAVKFTADGEVFIHVSLDPDQRAHSPQNAAGSVQSATREKAVLRFEVGDTGIGIAPQHRRMVFQTFCQADDSIRRQFGGTGLGLKISKQLTESMDGNIGFESREGVGSTFWCRIPFVLPEGESPAEIEPVLDGWTVFYLGNSRPLHQMLAAWIQAWGGRLIRVREAPEALEAMADDSRDDTGPVIWIDGSMESPGNARARMAKTLPPERSVQPLLILLVPRACAADSAAIRASGCDATLKLPVKHAALLSTVQAVITNCSAAAAPEEPAPGWPDTPACEGGGLRILLAEDNSANRLIAKRFLEKEGHRVDTVGDGRDAVDALRQWEYDLVFMDIQMPVMDGIEATRRLRRIEAESGLASTPVVAMTAHVMEEYKRRCLEAGMDDFVTKPIQPATLRAAISRQMPRIAARLPSAPATVPSSDHEAIFNLLKETFDNDYVAMADLLRIFLEGARGYHQRLVQAVAGNDREELKWVAHTLKGSAASFGSEHITALAELIENTEENGEFADLKPLLADLDTQIEALAKVRISPD